MTQASEAVAAQLAPRHREALVLGLGRARALSRALGDAGWEVIGDDAADVFEPAPDVVLVSLDDGGQSSADRRALLADALSRLHPGGVLVVVGCVVTAPGGPANPSISQLVDDLVEASGAMAHVDVVQSIRWHGEPFTRGVLLVVTSLAGGRDPQ